MSCYSFSCTQPYHQYDGAYGFGAWQRIRQAVHLLYMVGRVLLSRLCFTGDIVTLNQVGIKSGDSDVVIGYQVDVFTHTWSLECFMLDHTFNLVSWVMCQH